MTQLLSAPSEIASWDWCIDIEPGDGLEDASTMTLSISRILECQSLMELTRLQVSWHRRGQGPIGFRSLISIRDPRGLNTEALAEQIMASQPAGYPETEVGQIELLGSGYWINANGEKKREGRLIDVSILVTPDDISVTLGVRHDIWMRFDFSGKPHPNIYNSNKVRLSDTLKEIEETLGAETIPGDPTYFAEPAKYGIVTPEANSEGFGRNETHML